MKRLQLLALLCLTPCIPASAADACAADFSRARTEGRHSYNFTTEYRTYAPDGTCTLTEAVSVDFDLNRAADGAQTLECTRFTLTKGDGTKRTIPALEGWTHVLDLAAAEVMGIRHADFDNLVQDDGAPLPPELGYRVYNTFVDFYAFNNVFGDPQPCEGSIADLKTPGQTIRHFSAFSQPPVNLGGAIKEGSYFKNGCVTLTYDGTRTGERTLAIVDFDSGDSSLLMLMEPAPGMKINVKGGSHYWGTLYIDTADMWLEKASFNEVVLSEITIAETQKVTATIIRSGWITERE